jgi:hypothetical protein
MTVFTIYCWGVGVSTTIGVAMGWRKNMPLISNHRSDLLPPKDVIELVGVMLCFALVWPYLVVLKAYALWKRGRNA